MLKAKIDGTESPPPIPVIDTAAFRRKLAGMVDPVEPKLKGAADREHLKSAANRLCVILADLYGVDDKDRLQLWEHIAKAMDVADERATDGDVERFVSEALTAVQADGARAAAHAELGGLLAEIDRWPTAVRHAFLARIRTHRYAVLSFGQRRWKEVIAEREVVRKQRKSNQKEGGNGHVQDAS